MQITVVTLLTQEVDTLYEQQNNVAAELQSMLKAKRRLNDEELREVRFDKKANGDCVRLSIDYALLGVKIAKRNEVLERKETLIEKIKAYMSGKGVMKDELDTALHTLLKSKKGGLTEEQRLQRKWLLIDDEPAPAAAYVAPPPAYAPPAFAPPVTTSAPSTKTTAAPITKTGEPDKRYKR